MNYSDTEIVNLHFIFCAPVLNGGLILTKTKGITRLIVLFEEITVDNFAVLTLCCISISACNYL